MIENFGESGTPSSWLSLRLCILKIKKLHNHSKMFDWLRKLWKISHVLFRSFCAQVRNLSIFERAAPVPRPRDVLLNSLRGSRVIVPDITRLLQHWPREINPSISLLEDSVNDKLERSVSKAGPRK